MGVAEEGRTGVPVFERGKSGSTGKSRNQSSLDGSILLMKYAAFCAGMKVGGRSGRG